MIHIKSLELYREFQKNIMKVAESEALMCCFKEYTVSIRNHSTEVTIYLQGYAAVLTFYISGRVVIKYTVSKEECKETVLIDKTDWQYANGKCTVADLVSRYVYKVFDVALEMRQRRRTECSDRYKDKKAASLTKNDDFLETIREQPHTSCFSDNDNDVIEDDYYEVTKDRHMANFVHDY